MESVDLTIVGAGAVGLATAFTLADESRSTIILEQHSSFGTETSSRNSEVIHAGIYYPANSLKAVLCVQGKHEMYAYCEKYQIPHRRLGKFIVATKAAEEATLEGILKKALQNGVDDLTWQTAAALSQVEPNLKATLGLLSPSTGIIDSHSLMRSYLANAESKGAAIAYQAKVERVETDANGFVVHVGGKEQFKFRTRCLVNSGGLYAQKVSLAIDGLPRHSIPTLYLCKGNYFTLTGKSPFHRLIYPVPEPDGTGLGIHVTLDMAGQARFGPDTQYLDTIDYAVSMQNLAKFYPAIRRYYPGLVNDSLQPGYSGIRPKLQAPGAAVEDFVIQGQEQHQLKGYVALYGIESPGITASLAIAKRVKSLLQESL